jgi:hypothetical protein
MSNHLNAIGKRIKIVITSRPQIPIESYFPDVVKINLDSNNQNDIANYVHASVLELKKRNVPTELRQEIEETYRGFYWDVSLGLFDSIRSQNIFTDIATCDFDRS